MTNDRKAYWKKVTIIFILGFIGVLSMLPLIPILIEIIGQQPPISVLALQTISVLQSSIFLLGLVLLGAWAAPKVGLTTPIIDAYIEKSWHKIKLKNLVTWALLGGILGGTLLVLVYQSFLPHLPHEFLQNAEQFKPSLLTKLLYGGITEEIIMRWGLMSFFVWCSYRFTQSPGTPINSVHYLFGLSLAAILFGIGHLPVASILSSETNFALIAYILIANSLFGVIAGFLYWKKGLESAVLAHMIVHITIVIGENIR